MVNPFTEAPTPPNPTSRSRHIYRISALCLADNGHFWECQVVNVSLDRCRVIWLAEQVFPLISKLHLQSEWGTVVDIGVAASTVEHHGSVWIVDCQLGRPLTVTEMAGLL